MKYLILTISILVIACKINKNNLEKNTIEQSNLVGVYKYEIDRTKSNMFFNNNQFEITLTLFSDSSFEEVNRYQRCFGNYQSYAGIYEIKDSILICKRNSYLGQIDKDTSDDGQILKRRKINYGEISFLIKGDSLINLSNKKVVLKKQN